MKYCKKGFTLVELLAVIVILGIILVIAVPNIMKVIDNAKQNAYENQKRLIINAARNYVSRGNVSILDGEVVEVYLKDLQDANMIDDSVKDPRGGYFDNSKPDGVKVLITKDEDGNISYEIYVPDEEDGGEGDPPGDELLVDKFTPESAGSDGTYQFKNGSNYFVGPNPNNWIVFGRESSKDILWRVIKADEEGIKIIYEGTKNGTNPPTEDGKVTLSVDGYLTDVAIPWHMSGGSDSENKWEGPADLKGYLTTWYNNTFTATNKNFIEPVNWCIGGVVEKTTPPELLTDFTATECSNGTYAGGTYLGRTLEKTGWGLIKASDYMSTSSSANCDRNVRNCGVLDDFVTLTNFLYKGYSWWTMTANGKNYYEVWAVHPGGWLDRDYICYDYAVVRPVINLKPNVLYNSGDGTLASPYTIK
jgi:type IV pilus assembly protein PilA